MADYETLRDYCKAKFSTKHLAELTNVDGSGTTIDNAKLELACKESLSLYEHESRHSYDITNYNDLLILARIVEILLKISGGFSRDNTQILNDLKKELKETRKEITVNTVFEKFRDDSEGSFNNNTMEDYRAGQITGEDTIDNIKLDW